MGRGKVLGAVEYNIYFTVTIVTACHQVYVLVEPSWCDLSHLLVPPFIKSATSSFSHMLTSVPIAADGNQLLLFQAASSHIIFSTYVSVPILCPSLEGNGWQCQTGECNLLKLLTYLDSMPACSLDTFKINCGKASLV